MFFFVKVLHILLLNGFSNARSLKTSCRCVVVAVDRSRHDNVVDLFFVRSETNVHFSVIYAITALLPPSHWRLGTRLARLPSRAQGIDVNIERRKINDLPTFGPNKCMFRGGGGEACAFSKSMYCMYLVCISYATPYSSLGRQAVTCVHRPRRTTTGPGKGLLKPAVYAACRTFHLQAPIP